MTWVFADLTDDELRAYAANDCQCVTRERSGTRHGYVCAAHRAEKEIECRKQRDEALAAKGADDEIERGRLR